jgi:hypothetical protein
MDATHSPHNSEYTSGTFFNRKWNTIVWVFCSVSGKSDGTESHGTCRLYQPWNDNSEAKPQVLEEKPALVPLRYPSFLCVLTRMNMYQVEFEQKNSVNGSFFAGSLSSLTVTKVLVLQCCIFPLVSRHRCSRPHTTLPVTVAMSTNCCNNILSPCKIWAFHGGDYEEWRLLGCYAEWLL